MAMTHSAFIELLGNTGKVAAALGQNETTVSNWKKRVVPWRWRPAVAVLAKDAEVELPDGFLDPAASEGAAQ